MAIWREHLIKLRDLQTELLRAAPWRDTGLIGHPGASRVAIDAAEARVGHTLPPSYREFLALYDGWPRCFDGASLLGTATLGLREYEDAARATLSSTQAAVLGAPSRVVPRERSLLAFGADMALTTLFAFDLRIRDGEGECAVVAWIGEIGVRRESFTSFLELLVELAESELDAQRGADALRHAG